MYRYFLGDLKKQSLVVLHALFLRKCGQNGYGHESGHMCREHACGHNGYRHECGHNCYVHDGCNSMCTIKL